MILVRYATLVALVIWLGAMMDERFGELFRRAHLLTYACGAVTVVGLFVLKFLGPPPMAFVVRAGIAVLMLAIAVAAASIAPREASQSADDDQHRPGFPPSDLVRARMTHTITLIPGDGIGPEVTDAVVRILNAVRRLDRLGAARRRHRRVRADRPDAAGRTARFDSPQQGRAQGTGDDADRRRGSPASTSACARRSICTRTCGRCGTCPASTRASRASTW